jgi:FkbM family methyltransferase
VYIPAFLMKIPGFPALRARLRQMRLSYQSAVADGSRGAFWKTACLQYLWRRPFWYTDRYGVTLRLHPEDGLQYILAKRSHFDNVPTLEVVRQRVQPGMTVIDVGANYGQFAVFAALLVGERGCVHTFEPTSSSFERLQANVHHMNGLGERMHLNRSAVGNRIGSATIYEYSCSAFNSLKPHTMFVVDRPIEPTHTETVPLITLDKYCADHEIRQIDLLKVDVEGLEVEVLEGCQSLMKKKSIRCIIFEISQMPAEGAGYPPVRVLEAVQQMGFDVSCIREGGVLEAVHLPDFDPPFFANYLATPKA